MNDLNLTLTLKEVNALMDALGSRPFKQVHQLDHQNTDTARQSVAGRVKWRNCRKRFRLTVRGATLQRAFSVEGKTVYLPGKFLTRSREE